MKILISCLIAVSACITGIASAQTAPVKPAAATAMLDLHAFGTNGEKFTQDRIRGKVAIVFYWSTSCAVCRDSLPELRMNLNGWRDKPFALVTVNVDKNSGDWLAYERIQGQTQALTKGLIAVRQDEGKVVPMKLPLTLLVDAKGKVVARFEGRLAPEAWDGVADLMP
ncbi:MAG: TlpA disulfide reductase family protein [Pseudomonadota bacterium]